MAADVPGSSTHARRSTECGGSTSSSRQPRVAGSTDVRSLALITVWAGPLPPYLPLFLLTAANNASVDFIFVADSPPPPGLRPNIRWVHRPLERLMRQMSDQLDCELGVRAGYKLVDYKPAFGLALSEELTGYDFWGHLDCDTVLGDVRAFATADALEAHDVLIFRGREFVHGPLTIYRNVERINRLFQQAPDWRETFTDPEPRSFDEHADRPRIKGFGIAPAARAARGERVSMTDVVFDSAQRGRIRLFDQDHVVESNPADFPVALRYGQGRLYDEAPLRHHYRERRLVTRPQSDPREVLLYHLLYAKRDPGFHVPVWSELPERFIITHRGVSEAPSVPGASRAAGVLRYACASGRGWARRVYRRSRTSSARRWRRWTSAATVEATPAERRGVWQRLRAGSRREGR